AGILRSVYLLKLPVFCVQNIYLFSDFEGNLDYKVELNQRLMPEYEIQVLVKDKNSGLILWKNIGIKGNTKFERTKIDFWWPRGLGKQNLYIFEVTVMNVPKQKAVDVYRETFGFRSVNISNDEIFINGKPFYCAGFGMHEDFDLIGRGFSQAVMTKDLNMLEWMNGNCYRTSHYPYSEDRAYEADRRGIVVIAETPAVALKTFPEKNLELHKQMVIDLFERDHRHPSIIMWSLANEPDTFRKESRKYFK
ncbi:hypothetical protein FO519_010411, partial [Halicephalobus sp. NKZ332]